MPALEPVIATLVANTEEFQAAMAEAKASMAELGEGAGLADTEGDLAGLGAAGKKAGDDVKDGAEDAAGGLNDTKVAAEDAKGSLSDVSDGAALATIGLQDTHDAAEDAEGGLRDAESATKDVGTVAEDTGGKLSGLGSLIGGLASGPMGGFQSKAEGMKSSLTDASEGSDGFVGALGSIPVPALAAGAAVAAVAAISVKMAATFQTSMTQLVTGAGESQKNIALVSAGILNMAGAVGTSASDLSSGMYLIESAGFHGAAGLSVLQSAAEGAKVGAANLADVANVVTSALNAYGLQGKDATSITNQLVATVAAGKMHMQDLTTSIAAVLPVAASSKIAFSQIGGALATMTAQGMTARRASMGLANMIRALIAPSAQSSAEMQKLGLNANEVATHVGSAGLTGTLNQLTTAILKSTQGGQVMATGFQNMSPAAKAISERILAGTITTKGLTTAMQGLSPTQAKLVSQFDASATSATGLKQTFDATMKTMVGGATGLNVALLLTGTHAKTFADNVKSVADAAKHGGTQVQGFADVQKDLSFQLDSAKDSVQAIAIKLGTALLPAVTMIAKALAGFTQDVTKDWPEISKAVSTGFDAIKPALELFMKLLGDVVSFIVDHKPILIAAIAAIAVAFFPVTASALAFALAASEIIRHWSGVKDFFVDIWHGIETALAPVIDYVKIALDMLATVFKVEFDAYAAVVKIAFDVIKGIVTAAWDVIKGIFEVAIDLLTGDWTGAWNAMRNTVHAVLSDISGTISGVVGTFVGFFNQAWNAIKSGFTAAFNVVKGILDGFLSPVTSIIGSIVGFFTALPGEVANALGDFFTVAFAALTKVLGWINTNVWTPVSGFFTALPGKVASLLGDFFTVAWTALTKALDWLNSNVWAPVNTFFGGLPGKVAGAIGSFFSTAFSAMLSAGSWVNANVVQPIISTITGMPGTIAGDLSGFIASIFSGIGNVASWVDTNIVQPVVNEIKSIPGKIGSIGGQILGDITGGLGSLASHIPGLASGGYVTQPTLAMIGENGPEFVIPQSALSAGGVSALPNITPIAGGSTGGAGGGISAQIVNQPINLVVNGQTLAQIVTQFQLRGARSTGNVAGQWAGGTQSQTATGVNVNAVAR